MQKLYKFENKTTGKEIETNDLQFLMSDLKENKGLQLPNQVMADIILRGQTNCIVADAEGTPNHITITEYSNFTIKH